MRAALAVRAVEFQLAMRTGVAVRAVAFPFAVRGRGCSPRRCLSTCVPACHAGMGCSPRTCVSSLPCGHGVHVTQSSFRLPCGQGCRLRSALQLAMRAGLQAAQLRFSPCGHGVHVTQSSFRLPCGQGLQAAQMRFSLPCGQGLQAAQLRFSLPCGHGVHVTQSLFSLPWGSPCSPRSCISPCHANTVYSPPSLTKDVSFAATPARPPHPCQPAPRVVTATRRLRRADFSGFGTRLDLR